MEEDKDTVLPLEPNEGEPLHPLEPSTPVIPDDVAEWLSDFRTNFPEFLQEFYSNEAVLSKRRIALEYVSSDRFDGPLYNYATGLVVAHMLTLASRALGANGMVTGDANRRIASKAVGGVSVAYEAMPVVGEGLSLGTFGSTSYGQEYLALVRRRGVGAVCL